MKTITKMLAVLGLAAIGLVGCAESNEKINSTDAAGKQTVGQPAPAGASSSSEDFMKKNKGLMGNEKKAEDYKAVTGQDKK